MGIATFTVTAIGAVVAFKFLMALIFGVSKYLNDDDSIFPSWNDIDRRHEEDRISDDDNMT